MSQLPSPAYPPFQISRNSQLLGPNAPPAPPPRPSSQEVSRSIASLPPPPAQHQQNAPGTFGASTDQSSQQARMADGAQTQLTQDPGELWLPKILEDKSKQDLAEALSKPQVLAALTHSSSTSHASVSASQGPLQAALKENVALASHLNELEARLTHLRSSTQAQLLSTHALERQWRQKQSEMDRALAPFSPSSLYQKLSQAVQEQEMVCRAMEESFLDGDGGAATEREAGEWVRKYREAKKVHYLRQERKERWDEGRVGGWR